MQRFIQLFFYIYFSIGLLIGCSVNENTVEVTEVTDETVEETTEAFPVTVTDATGEEVTLEEKPEKIISLLPSNTEIAFALGLNDQIIAVTDNDDYPAEVAEKERIGGYEIDVEKIIALAPDLVLAHELNVVEGIEQLRANSVPVLVVKDANDFAEVYETIELIGKATGTSDAAHHVITEMERHLNDIEAKLAHITDADKKYVYLEISGEPEIYTAAAETLFDHLLTLAKGHNIFADEVGWPQVSEETVLEKDPDVIIALYNYVEDPVADILQRSGWQDVTAVQKQQVYHVDENIVSRPGPRLTEGVEELAKAIYPDAFSD